MNNPFNVFYQMSNRPSKEKLAEYKKRIDMLSAFLKPFPPLPPKKTESSDGSKSGDCSGSEDSIVDSLMTCNSMMEGALGEREILNKLMGRSSEVETYFDPKFFEEHQQVRSKEVYLNAIAPDLHEQCEQLETVKRLEPTLGAEYFRNIPSDCIEKLKQCAGDNTEFAQQAELIEESLILAMKRYGEIQTALLQQLDNMNKRLDAVEEELEMRKRAELEKELPSKDEE